MLSSRLPKTDIPVRNWLFAITNLLATVVNFTVAFFIKVSDYNKNGNKWRIIAMKQSSTNIKEFDQISFYQDYYNLTVEDFRQKCITLISSARAPNYTLIEQLKKITNKDVLLKSVNNFILKGHGYGVL